MLNNFRGRAVSISGVANLALSYLGHAAVVVRVRNNSTSPVESRQPRRDVVDLGRRIFLSNCDRFQVVLTSINPAGWTRRARKLLPVGVRWVFVDIRLKEY